jgi:light-regulated signal transduction histidine kinase (bacteriophytochrome)
MTRIQMIAPFLLTLTGLAGMLSLPVADAAEPTADKYLLRYQFTPGEFVRYEVVDQASVTTRKNDAKETVRNQSQVWRHYRVVSVNEAGQATLELMIDRVRMIAQFEDAPPTVFDSADPNLQPKKFSSVLQSVNRPMSRIVVDAQGDLLSAHSLLQGKTDQTDPAINFLVVFPEQAQSLGATWKQTLEVEVPVTDTLKEKVKLIRNYTLKSVEDDIATIHLATILASQIRDPAVRTRLMQQTPSGTIQFDMKTQQLIFRETKVDDQIIGAFGTGTLVETKSRRTEKLIPAAPAEDKPTDSPAKLSQTR